MSKSEMRMIRREWINAYLPSLSDTCKPHPLSVIKYWVRYLERVNYGEELKAYA